jgi:hypothetical protein
MNLYLDEIVIEYVRLLPQELRWREVVLDHGPGVQAG